MSTIGRSVGLATAFLAGIAIAANADSPSRAGAGASAPIADPPSSTSLGSRGGVGPSVNSLETVRTEHYRVPEDNGANIALDPYKRGVSPRPGD
jgi:hypothetical protein